MVERLHQVGDLNERRGKLYAMDCDFAEDYPYAKTEVGALQLRNMPWDLKSSAVNYFGLSCLSFVMGASIF